MKKSHLISTVLTLSLSQFLVGCESNSQGQTQDVTNISPVQAGQKLFAQLCSSCHGSTEKPGGMGGNVFDDEWNIEPTRESLIDNIVNGNQNSGMPAFGAQLDSEEVDHILAYIQAGRDGGVTTDVNAAQTQAQTPAQTPDQTLRRDAPNLVAAVDKVESVQDTVMITDWVSGLDEPWGFAFTGTNSALVTEKNGPLRVVENGVLLDAPVANTPTVRNNGQGGLMDVTLDPDYANTGWVYLSYSHPADDDQTYAMTRIVRGKIVNGAWTEQQVLFEADREDYINTRFHYGSRITFDASGQLYFGIGDRGKKEMAQDLSVPNGKIHRINRDGTIPQDNPFVEQDDAYASIWAYGNRNPQGLIVHPSTGDLWETEHGPRGGDELNLIRPGVNYGWPEISYGINYSGTVLTPFTAKPGMAQPESHWTPSIAVCGLDVYQGDLFPKWQGHLLVGGLASETVRVVDVSGGTYQSEVSLINGEGRVRDVTPGPDGAIYVALPNKIVKVTPRSQ